MLRVLEKQGILVLSGFSNTPKLTEKGRKGLLKNTRKLNLLK